MISMLFLDTTLEDFYFFFLILPFTQNLCVRLMPHLVVVAHMYYNGLALNTTYVTQDTLPLCSSNGTNAEIAGSDSITSKPNMRTCV